MVGYEALIIRTHDGKVIVNGFTPVLGSKTVDVVDTSIVYEYEFTGKVLIMIIRHGFHLKEMKQNLLSPFIMRLAGLEVNEQPKFMTRNPTTKHHFVNLNENDIRIPFVIRGIVCFLLNRKINQEEYLNIGTRLELTPSFTEWDPHNPSYGIRKNCMLDHDGNINSNINTTEDSTVENPVIGTCEVGVSSIMTSISQFILCNTCIPDSTLKKKNHAIAYHFVREVVARE